MKGIWETCIRALGNKVDENEHLAHHGMIKIKEAWACLSESAVENLGISLAYNITIYSTYTISLILLVVVGNDIALKLLGEYITSNWVLFPYIKRRISYKSYPR